MVDPLAHRPHPCRVADHGVAGQTCPGRDPPAPGLFGEVERLAGASVNVLCHPAQQRVPKRSALGQRRRKVFARITEHGDRGDRDDIGADGRRAKNRQLAEGLAGSEPEETLIRLLLRSQQDIDLALEDRPRRLCRSRPVGRWSRPRRSRALPETTEIVEGLVVEQSRGGAFRDHQPSVPQRISVVSGLKGGPARWRRGRCGSSKRSVRASASGPVTRQWRRFRRSRCSRRGPGLDDEETALRSEGTRRIRRRNRLGIGGLVDHVEGGQRARRAGEIVEHRGFPGCTTSFR